MVYHFLTLVGTWDVCLSSLRAVLPVGVPIAQTAVVSPWKSFAFSPGYLKVFGFWLFYCNRTSF